MTTTTIHYEIMFINPVLTEEIYEECIEKYKAIIEKTGGILNKVDQWGVKRLAYEIENQNEGRYTLFKLTADRNVIKEIDRNMKIDENVLRHIIIRTSH